MTEKTDNLPSVGAEAQSQSRPSSCQSQGATNHAGHLSHYKKMTRRDACQAIGMRAYLLTSDDRLAARAWKKLSFILMDELSMDDVPKFRKLLRAIRRATIEARKATTPADV